MTGSTVASPQAGPLLHATPAATMQTPHLTQPDTLSSPMEGARVIRADGCVGSSLCRPATRRPRPLARPRRAEQVPSGLPDGCDPGAGCSAGPDRVLIRACTVASPKGASEGGTGFPLGCDPVDAQGPAGDAPWPAPLSHPHKAGVCRRRSSTAVGRQAVANANCRKSVSVEIAVKSNAKERCAGPARRLFHVRCHAAGL